MAEPIRVLLVEDSEDDALLLVRALEHAGYAPTWERVDTAPALAAVLEGQTWDVVLLDYVMPQLSPLTALEIIQEHGLDIPSIIVSGKVTDETAIAAMKAGAQDFVPKDALPRLPQAIERERRAAQARRAARDNEARLQAIFDTAVDGIITIDERAVVESINPAAASMLGYAPEEVIGRNVNLLMPEPYHSEHQEYINRYLRTGEPRIIGIGRDVEARRKDGTTFPIRLSVSEAHVGGHRIFTGILHDVSERQRAEAERARLLEAAEVARDQAEEAAAAKDQFVAMVSHELRNPLNAITAGLYLLHQSCPNEGRAQRALEIVQRNANLQARLVNDLLDLSRLQRGKLPLLRAPVDLAKVILPACRTTQAEAAEAGLTLTCDSEPDLWINGDEDRLHQVLMNLLSNALKFTPPPGAVTVSASRTDDSVRMQVADTGIGISPSLVPHLFEVFSQGEIAAQRAAGLGLGLALVKGIIERHGGRVCAESEGVGKGARFTVELPLITLHAPTPRTTPRTLHQQPCILIVEDNADTRTVLADALTLAGYDVRTAPTAEEALDLLTEVTPDVLLVDIGLPGMDGYDFVRRAHAIPGMQDVPAFAATGFGTQEDVQRGREAGFLGHFVKPLDIRALDHRLRELIGLPPT